MQNIIAPPTMATTTTFDYVFGFGSIINTDTHAPWIGGTGAGKLHGQRAKILSSFGFQRGWIFRSNTGFTALGITKKSAEEATDIHGVLFRIPPDLFAGFDRREVGYDRVLLEREHLELHSPSISGGDVSDGFPDDVLDIQPHEKIWVYIPQPSYCAEANEDHPILQSYVDTVLHGCLEWGGEQMAADFVASTHNWSPFFLNDTPSSRRPWLFRKEYNKIDSILADNPVTHYADRRHPEEFASAFLIKLLRGTWSVPRRNTAFTGRDMELGRMHGNMISQRTNSSSGVAKFEVAGMGGVGKTQICTEYCYRYFPSYYGLVIWLSAQDAESIAACYRQLMTDTTGVDVQDKDTDEVVAEVKARLFRSKVPWLLVFDNLEDRSLLEKFVPHGGGCGHILVTTRFLDTDLVDDQTMMLGCFNPSESVELLCRSAKIEGSENVDCAKKLAECLGHLPLALSMAAAYMRRCDVDCAEYLARYVQSEGAPLGHQAVASSLSLSLNAIKKEDRTAWEALRLMGWLGPDRITKALVRSLLRAKKEQAEADANQKAANDEVEGAAYQKRLVGGVALLSLITLATQVGLNRRMGALSSAILVTTSIAMTILPPQSSRSINITLRRSSSFSANQYEQTDLIWKILKSFSILAVKDSKGSMHRLLAQSLRASQTDEDAYYNLQICIRAVQEAWNFDPDQVETWRDSANILGHVKAIAFEASSGKNVLPLETSILSREAGVFSAMALNRFEEAKVSLEQSLDILAGSNQQCKACDEARASTLHELGRVFRYQGCFPQAEEALQSALQMRKDLSNSNSVALQDMAATLHELGVLESKKYNLGSATDFLERALGLRRSLEADSSLKGIEAECASTLHQLAAVHLARKPPALDKAERLLNEALGLRMQIGPRAATLKQLARVAIRRGEFDTAEESLAQALELYIELYGEKTLHCNVASVKFQQGALAFQREQFEDAWLAYSDCLRARKHVYAYSQGSHLEVSSVLHELGRVAFSQERFSKANEMLQAERVILDELNLASGQHQRMLQSRLTNLTWLRKCAKELGEDDVVRQLAVERADLKDKDTQEDTQTKGTSLTQPQTLVLQREASRCRALVRKVALATSRSESNIDSLRQVLEDFALTIGSSPPSAMKNAANDFHETVTEMLKDPKKNKAAMLEKCDLLRDTLREQGLQVQDTVHKKGKS